MEARGERFREVQCRASNPTEHRRPLTGLIAMPPEGRFPGRTKKNLRTFFHRFHRSITRCLWIFTAQLLNCHIRLPTCLFRKWPLAVPAGACAGGCPFGTIWATQLTSLGGGACSSYHTGRWLMQRTFFLILLTALALSLLGLARADAQEAKGTIAGT